MRKERKVIMKEEIKRKRKEVERERKMKENEGEIGCRKKDIEEIEEKNRIEGIFKKIEKKMKKMVEIGIERRKGWIVIIDEEDFKWEKIERNGIKMVKKGMDIERSEIDGEIVGKKINKVKKRENKVGIIGDKKRKREILIDEKMLKKMRRKENKGKRVIDIVRKNGWKEGKWKRRKEMSNMEVDILRNDILIEENEKR